MSFRAYTFTWNDTVENPMVHHKTMALWLMNEGLLKYCVVGYEIGEKCGRKHLQGFVNWSNKHSMRALKRKYPGVYWIPANGSDFDNQKYCTKDGDYTELGEPTEQGRRTDLEHVKDMLVDGANMRAISAYTLNAQCIKAAQTWLGYHERVRDWVPEIIWLYGPTGSGKTRRAHELCADSKPWVSLKDLQWWQGYDAHENVIIDEFRRDYCTFHELLRITDRYEYQVRVLYGSRQLLAKRMIFTSCFHPEQLYETREDLKQLTRRISRIEHIVAESDTNPGPEVGGNIFAPTSTPTSETTENWC